MLGLGLGFGARTWVENSRVLLGTFGFGILFLRVQIPLWREKGVGNWRSKVCTVFRICALTVKRWRGDLVVVQILWCSVVLCMCRGGQEGLVPVWFFSTESGRDWKGMAKKGARTTEMADYEVHVPLQAVLLADSFAQKFRPITLERPKVRFPMSTFSLFPTIFFFVMKSRTQGLKKVLEIGFWVFFPGVGFIYFL